MDETLQQLEACPTSTGKAFIAAVRSSLMGGQAYVAREGSWGSQCRHDRGSREAGRRAVAIELSMEETTGRGEDRSVRGMPSDGMGQGIEAMDDRRYGQHADPVAGIG